MRVASRPCSRPLIACQVSIPSARLQASRPDAGVPTSAVNMPEFALLGIPGDDSWKSQQTLMGLWSVPIRDEHDNHLSGLRGPQAAHPNPANFVDMCEATSQDMSMPAPESHCLAAGMGSRRLLDSITEVPLRQRAIPALALVAAQSREAPEPVIAELANALLFWLLVSVGPLLCAMLQAGQYCSVASMQVR